MRRMALIVVLSALLASIVSAAAADHELKLIPSNTHTGSFDARIKPVLRIAPGDTVKVETLVPFGMDRLLAAGASEAEIPDSVKAMDKYMKEKGLYGGTLTGPIYIEGAQTGDMLEVQMPAPFNSARVSQLRRHPSGARSAWRLRSRVAAFRMACRGRTPVTSTSRN